MQDLWIFLSILAAAHRRDNLCAASSARSTAQAAIIPGRHASVERRSVIGGLQRPSKYRNRGIGTV